MNKAETKQKNKKETKKEIRITKQIIKKRLINHFKNHIGEENKTNQEEIFQVVIGVNSLSVNGFTRFYFWDSINKEIKKLRKENKCFIIKKGGYYFVLKEQNESNFYKAVCDKAIKGMEKSKIRADDWVETEKWRKFENEPLEVEEETENTDEEEQNFENRLKNLEEQPTEEKIIENIKSLNEKAEQKTKVIKMFKDENNNK